MWSEARLDGVHFRDMDRYQIYKSTKDIVLHIGTISYNYCAITSNWCAKAAFFESFEDRILHWHPLVLSLLLWRCQAAEWDKHEPWHGGTILLLISIFHIYPLLRFDVWTKWQLHLRTKTTHTPHFVFNYQLTCRDDLLRSLQEWTTHWYLKIKDLLPISETSFNRW